MKSLQHTSSYGLLVALMLTSMHIDAHSPSFYQKAVRSVVQQTKKAAHLCKSKLAAVKKMIEQKTHTEKQHVCIAMTGVALIYLSLCLVVNLNAPHTETKLLKALRWNDQATIDDYLDNGRVQPNDLVKGHPLLFWAAHRKRKETVRKLLAMEADPRNLNEWGRSVVDDIKYQINSRIESHIATMDALIAAGESARVELLGAQIEEDAQFFENETKPLLVKRAKFLTRSELRPLLRYAHSHEYFNFSPEICENIARFLGSTILEPRA